MNTKKGYTIVEIIVAVGIFALLMVVLIQFLRTGPRDTDRVMGKMTSRQEARLAFRRMCNEIREATNVILPDNDIHFKQAEYIYKYQSSDPGPDEHYGPSINSLFIESFKGDIISYFFYHEAEGSDLDGNGRCDANQLRRLNITKRVKDPSVRARIVARGVRADSTSPSIFTIARYFPGKQPSSVTIKLSILEQKKDEAENYYSLLSSVFLRNVGHLVENE